MDIDSITTIEDTAERRRDWETLRERTARDGYFHVPSKSTPETDRLLGEYYLKYGKPFNILENFSN